MAWSSVSAARSSGLSAIRAHRYAIGGYASLFYRLTTKGAVYRAGAFRASDVRYLLLNHAGFSGGQALPSLAAVARGTLHVETDARGLWFEAALPDSTDGERLMHQVCERRVDVSIGWEAYVSDATMINGARVYRTVSVFEISLLTRPGRAGCPDTWVYESSDALRRRRYDR